MGRSGLICAFLLAVCCCSRRAAGVPGEAEQPEPELVEVEVGHTALLKCGLSHAQGNLSHVDWFSVHKEKRMPIFRVRQGRGRSAAGDHPAYLASCSTRGSFWRVSRARCPGATACLKRCFTASCIPCSSFPERQPIKTPNKY